MFGDNLEAWPEGQVMPMGLFSSSLGSFLSAMWEGTERLNPTAFWLGHLGSGREQSREQKQGGEGEAGRTVARGVRKVSVTTGGLGQTTQPVGVSVLIIIKGKH